MFQNKRGFTLVEILIALFIFTIISSIIAGALHQVFMADNAAQKKTDTISDLQTAFIFIANDLRAVVNRPIKNSANTEESAFLGFVHSISFTRGGVIPIYSAQSHLQRVEYIYVQNNLYRATWNVLDRVNDIPHKKLLVKDLVNLYFQYLDNDNRLQGSWPIDNSVVAPKGVKITFMFKGDKKISQLFLIPGNYAINKT